MQALGARTAIVAPSTKLSARAPVRKVRAPLGEGRIKTRVAPDRHPLFSPRVGRISIAYPPHPRSPQVAARAAVTPKAGIPIHIEYCEK